ncbi:MAG TPA: hypothetical protein VE860_04425 [Chthoniobacterales bacterium]|nr:hypothetical protein [Chthoniobacterales bacterium]
MLAVLAARHDVRSPPQEPVTGLSAARTRRRPGRKKQSPKAMAKAQLPDRAKPPFCQGKSQTKKSAQVTLSPTNENSDLRSEKWVINESLLFTLTGCYREAIKR